MALGSSHARDCWVWKLNYKDQAFWPFTITSNSRMTDWWKIWNISDFNFFFFDRSVNIGKQSEIKNPVERNQEYYDGIIVYAREHTVLKCLKYTYPSQRGWKLW